jgi:chromosome segregation ATPase
MNPEIEELQKKRAGLETELHSLTEQEQNLDDKVKILEEKLSIQDLNMKIEARRDTISQFEARVKELEEKLENPWKEEAPAQWQEPTEQVAMEPEPEPEAVEEASLDEEIAVIEPEAPKPEHQEPRRKRKFF